MQFSRVFFVKFQIIIVLVHSNVKDIQKKKTFTPYEIFTIFYAFQHACSISVAVPTYIYFYELTKSAHFILGALARVWTLKIAHK